MIVGVYVDDLIVIGGNKEEVELFKKEMNQEFEMSDLGLFYITWELKYHKNCLE